MAWMTGIFLLHITHCHIVSKDKKCIMKKWIMCVKENSIKHLNSDGIGVTFLHMILDFFFLPHTKIRNWSHHFIFFSIGIGSKNTFKKEIRIKEWLRGQMFQVFKLQNSSVRSTPKVNCNKVGRKVQMSFQR